MATDVGSQTEPSVTRLVSGIIDDTQRLLEQHANLLKEDLRKDLREAKDAGLAMGLASALLGAGGLLLLFMLVYLLHEQVQLPLWGSFGIVGGILAVIGGALFFRGQQKVENFNPLPEQSVEAMKEDLQWKTNQK